MPGPKAQPAASPSAAHHDQSSTEPEAAPPEEEGEEEEEPWVTRAKQVFTESDWEEVGECDAQEDDPDRDAKIEAHNEHVQGVLERREQKLATAAELLEDPGDDDGADEEEEQVQARAEEGDDEDEDEDEEADEEADAGAADPDAFGEGVERMGLEDVPEEFVTVYSKKTYGVPDRAMLLKGAEALEFETADAMNEVLVSKSPKPFVRLLRTRHMSVCCSDERRLPPGAVVVDGKCNGQKLEEFPFETFLYIRCYVKPDPNDPASVTRAAHDKRRLRHLTKAVAAGVHKHMMGLDIMKQEARRAALQPLVDWQQNRDPQVVPKVAKWPLYEGLALETAYQEKKPEAPRKIGPNSKKAHSGAGQTLLTLAATSRKSSSAAAAPLKRKVGSKVVNMDDESDDESGRTEEPQGTVNPTDVVKRRRYFQVEDGAKTHVYVTGNIVGIIEHY